MGISVIGGATGGGSPIKSIQRGVTTSAATVTIAAIDPAKSFVNSFSNGSTGNVGFTWASVASSSAGAYAATSALFGADWASKSFGAYIASSTELVTTGPTRWEIVEYV